MIVPPDDLVGDEQRMDRHIEDPEQGMGPAELAAAKSAVRRTAMADARHQRKLDTVLLGHVDLTPDAPCPTCGAGAGAACIADNRKGPLHLLGIPGVHGARLSGTAAQAREAGCGDA